MIFNIRRNNKCIFFTKFINKGFGIIIDDETKKEIFAHYSNIKTSGNLQFSKLVDNQAVIYNIQEENGKTCAMNIELYNTSNNLYTNNSDINNSNSNNSDNIRKGWGNKLESDNQNRNIHFKKNSSNGKVRGTGLRNGQDFREQGDKGISDLPRQPNNKVRNRRRNTTNFKPSHEPVDMRIVVENNNDKYTKQVTSRDIILIKDFFKKEENIYEKLNNEIKNSGLKSEELWKSWHGDSHFIADDHINWKNKCPTFQYVLTKIAEYFDMDIKATRLNFYTDSKEWKPFHHDAAAIKEDKANTQNITVAVSFGLEREVAFQHAKNYSVISTPIDDGSIYVFCKDVNIIWKHGIRQMKDEDYINKGRYSIIAWGWRKMIEF